MTDEQYNPSVAPLSTPPAGIVGAIAWGIETSFDELIHIIVIAAGAYMAVAQTPIPEWYAAIMGLIIADLLKKKFKSEQ